MTTPPTIAGRVPSPFRVAFTTRLGGVSTGEYASLNLGLLTEDEPSAVLDNRSRVLAGLDVDPARASMCRQVHGTAVSKADARGIESARPHPERDGVWTDRPLEAVVVLSADCMPIALCRTGSRPAIAAVHAGWRGLIGGVLESAVAELGAGERVLATVGPSIGPCCYEVADDVAGPFSARFGRSVVQGRKLDLRMAARSALKELGVAEIETIDLCTACDSERFFSHRRDRGQTGRQGLVAFIEEADS